MIEEKISNIQSLLQEQDIDTLVLANMGHQVRDDLLYYLLLTHLELGILIIPQVGKPTLYAIPFEVSQLQQAHPELQVKPLEKKWGALTAALEGSVGYRPSALPTKYTINNDVALQGEDRLMSIKSAQEIDLLREAARLTDDIFSKLLAAWPTFKTEQDAAEFIILESIKAGVEPSFPPIVASGANAANPHHHPAATLLQPGFCVIDMGVRYKGYCSDMTRTIYIGTPSKDERNAYNRILDAQTKTIDKINININIDISSLSKFCRQELGPDFEPYFIHSLGHGLGTQVHEWPRISKKEDLLLEENMYITIEPGVYIPNAWGIRIEDDVLITKKGPVVLTTSPKELKAV